MSIYGTFKIPTKVIDGKETMVYIQSWAVLNLSPEEYTAFLAAEKRQHAIWDEAVTSGTVIRNNVDVAGNAIELTNPNFVGQEVTFVGEPPIGDAEFETFLAQYRADASLTWETPELIETT